MKTTLITGAGRGIGEEIAMKFASENHNLILLVQKKKKYLNILKKTKKFNIDVNFYVGDLKSQKFLNFLNKKINKIDNLVNNAALANTKYFLEVTNKQLDDITNVNLKAIFKLSKIFAKKMVKKKIKGNIINIGSVSSKNSMAYAPSYSATKSAIESLTKSMAACWAEHNVRVNCVAPGMIEGKTLDKLTKEVDTVDYLLQRIPLKRYGSPVEVAEAVLFLSSEKAAYITGTTIFVDGGYSIN